MIYDLKTIFNQDQFLRNILDKCKSEAKYGIVTCKADNVIDLSLQNLTMIRMPVTKSCFLSEGTENVPKPADLVKLLVRFYFSFF